MERVRIDFVDEQVVEVLMERGYKIVDNALLVDQDELMNILNILDDEEELDFEERDSATQRSCLGDDE
jgi:hypothetical protein